jgi:hypothetical protein
MSMGGSGHNLLPFEWADYGFFGLIATAGALAARLTVDPVTRAK